MPLRKTFYGDVPCTAEEMYLHTKNVNNYYFGEIGIEADNEGTIYECRKRGFECLERTPDFLSGRLQEGSYGEMWSVRKVLRRFIWHDRTHAKAMWKMAKKTFGESESENVFFCGEVKLVKKKSLQFSSLCKVEDVAILYFLRNGVKRHLYSLDTIFDENT